VSVTAVLEKGGSDAVDPGGLRDPDAGGAGIDGKVDGRRETGFGGALARRLPGGPDRDDAKAASGDRGRVLRTVSSIGCSLGRVSGMTGSPARSCGRRDVRAITGSERGTDPSSTAARIVSPSPDASGWEGGSGGWL
jgi:hypothetical protein